MHIRRKGRDEFNAPVKMLLAKRVGFLCSNPECGAHTQGPKSEPRGSVSIGVAAHITAASPGGPRYNPALSELERGAADNGIWLCQNCATLIDRDSEAFNEQRLRLWKDKAEAGALARIGKRSKSSKKHLERFEKDIAHKLRLREEMQKRMLKSPIPYRQVPPLRPPHKFAESEVIIRCVEEHDTYPELPDRPGISPWFKLEVWDFYHNGIEVILGLERGIIDDAGNWAVLPFGTEFDRSKFAEIKLWILGRIPFRNIFRIDWEGDEYYRMPHIYCHFSNGGEPYEEKRYLGLGEEYDWPLDTARRVALPPAGR